MSQVMRIQRRWLFVIAGVACMMASCKKTVSDDQLTKDVQASLYADATTKPANINVAAQNGVVTLTGDVGGADIHAEAVKVAKGVDGVSSVTDQLTVNGVAAANQQPAPAAPQASAPAAGGTQYQAQPAAGQPTVQPGSAQYAATPASAVTPASAQTYPPAPVAAEQPDPPSRVARLSFMEGNVSMEPAGVNDWAPAVINRPFTTGDYVYADQGAHAELQMDIATLRMGPLTNIGFLNLNDQTVQIKLAEGEMCFRLHDFGGNQVFEIDTPNAAVTFQQDGMYRINVDASGNSSLVIVRQGQAQVTGGGQALTVSAGNSAYLSGANPMQYSVQGIPSGDQFDNWCNQREGRHRGSVSAQYVPPTVVGSEDLDDYGSWQQAPEYGAVWYPRSTPAGWAPYHNGHWAWVSPWGWTWVDDAQWGFAPFHYGRWAYTNNRWGWCPGPLGLHARGPVERPYYAPALVVFLGGAAVLSARGAFGGGGGPAVGWVPLGFGEVYRPPYRVSPNYFRNVNVSNTNIVKTVNITNVYNTTYVNKTVINERFVNMSAPNAVMAMPQTAFSTGRPVAQQGKPISAADVAKLPPGAAAVLAPQVAPTRQAVMPSFGTRAAARPPQQVVARMVVARSAPAAAPVPFAQSQAYMQQHAGQPVNYQAMRAAVVPHPAPTADVRAVPAARPVAVHAGEHSAPIAAVRPAPQPAAGRPEIARPGQPPVVPPKRQPVPQPQVAEPAAHGAPPNVRPVAPGRPVAPERPAAPGPGHPVPAAARPDVRPAPAAKVPPPVRVPPPQLKAPQPVAPQHTAPPPAQHTVPPPVENKVAPAAQHSPPPGQHNTAPERAVPAARPPQATRPEPAKQAAPPARGAPPPKAKEHTESKEKEKEKKDTEHH